MKKYLKLNALLVFTVMLLLSGSKVYSQMKIFTWDTYRTKFKVPSDFVIDESNTDYWIGHNTNINLSIYPRKGEQLTKSEMTKAIYNWAKDNGVNNIGDAVELDEKKMNGYQGVLYEGDKDGFSVGTMLLVDPDYPDISIYLWVSYREDQAETVLEMLQSFTPN